MFLLKEFKPTRNGMELNAVEAEDLLNFSGFGGWNGFDGRLRGDLLNDKGLPIVKEDPKTWDKQTIMMGRGFNLRIDNIDVCQGFANCKFYLIRVNPAFAYLRIEKQNKTLDIDLNSSFETTENFIKSRDKK